MFVESTQVLRVSRVRTPEMTESEIQEFEVPRVEFKITSINSNLECAK